MDVDYKIRDIFDNRGEHAFHLPERAPTVTERFAVWALQKVETATTRKAIYGAMIVLGHRYFADIRKHPGEQASLHHVYQMSFEALEERALELDPVLPSGETQVIGEALPPQAAGVFYQDAEAV